MAQYSFIFIAVLGCGVALVAGYGSGAPNSPAICGDLTPKHGVNPQDGASPYKLSVDKTQVKPGEEVQITISGGAFKGFLVQGRQVGPNTETPAGKFIAVKNTGESQPLNCGDIVGSSITHTNNKDKSKITLTWVAPESKGTYQLLTTVVKDGATFWVKQPSESINVN